MQMADVDIGGARVRRLFRSGDVPLRAGTILSAEEVCAFPAANRRALIEAGFIDVFPRGPVESVGECHIVHMGGGKYDVIKGIKLNDEPLTKEEAEDLATKPD